MKCEGRYRGPTLYRPYVCSAFAGHYPAKALSTSGVNPAVFPFIVRTSLAQGKPEVPRPYSAIPHDLLRDRRLIATDVVVVGSLLVYARAGASCWPSVNSIANDIGRSRRTVQLSLRRLRDTGWIGSRPADNPTGRSLVLLWREGAQSTAHPGRNQLAGGGAQSASHELKNQKEKPFASPPGGKPAAADPIESPMSPDELRAFFATIRPKGLERRQSDPQPGRPNLRRSLNRPLGNPPRPLFG